MGLCKWLSILNVYGENSVCTCMYCVLQTFVDSIKGKETPTNVCNTVTELKVAFGYFYISEDSKNTTGDV